MAHTWNNTPVVSKVTTTNGTTYWYKDAEARSVIEDIETRISGGVHWIGVTTTTLTDGSTTNPISIGGSDVTAENGDMVSYQPASGQAQEFVWNGALTTPCWQEIGSTGSLKAFAFVDQGTASYTPSVTVPQTTITATGGTTDNVLGEATTFSGAASAVTFDTATSGNTAAAITAMPTATVPKPSGTTKYIKPTTQSADAITALPSATVPKTSSTTKYLTASASGAALSTTDGDAVTAMPTATVSKVTTTNTKKYLTTTSVAPFGSAGTLPTFTSSVSDETLSFSFSQGTLPSAGTSVTVATGKVANSDTNGDQVVTDTGNSTSGTLSVTFGTPTTAKFLKTASVGTQPSVTLTSASSTSTGAVSYISAVSTSGTNNVTFGDPTTASFLTSVGLDSSSSTSTGAVSYISAVSTSGTNNVTFGTPTTATVLTSSVTATAAGQTVTAGTNDKVSVYKSGSMPTYKMPQTTASGSATTITVNPKTT